MSRRFTWNMLQGDIPAQEANVMDACTQTLEASGSEVAYNVNDDI